MKNIRVLVFSACTQSKAMVRNRYFCKCVVGNDTVTVLCPALWSQQRIQENLKDKGIQRDYCIRASSK
jgi:hypothetical protein